MKKKYKLYICFITFLPPVSLLTIASFIILSIFDPQFKNSFSQSAGAFLFLGSCILCLLMAKHTPNLKKLYLSILENTDLPIEEKNYWKKRFVRKSHYSFMSFYLKYIKDIKAN